MEENFSIAEWLATIDLAQHAKAFEENGITPDTLLLLTDEDLKKYGIKTLGHRIKIIFAIDQLKTGNVPGLVAPQAPAAPLSFPAGNPPPRFNPPRSPMAASSLGQPRKPTVPPQAPLAPAPQAAGPKSRTPIWDRFGGRFLYISILVHVIFALVATWLIVQNIESKRKLTFRAGEQGPKPNSRAVEHKVQVTKKINTMSAPAQAKRITTTAISARVSIPEMTMPSASNLTPGRLAGMGGEGLSMGTMSMGAGSGGGGGGGGMPFFGLRTSVGSCVQGTFYDLKQDPSGKPTEMANPPVKWDTEECRTDLYVQTLQRFIRSGWSPAVLGKYFQGPTKLYANRIFTPVIAATEAPKAFGVGKLVKPSRWLVHYKGTVSPPESGTYHFVGAGDDVMVVRFNKRLLLDACWFMAPNIKQEPYKYSFPGPWRKGPAFQASAGTFYEFEAIIGEQPGGQGWGQLLIEKEGENYEKGPGGSPILPVFRFADQPLPKGKYVVHMEGGPVWQAKPPAATAIGTSIFQH